MFYTKFLMEELELVVAEESKLEKWSKIALMKHAKDTNGDFFPQKPLIN